MADMKCRYCGKKI